MTLTVSLTCPAAFHASSGLLRHLEAQELAELVQELYTEGTLSYQELRELSHMPELHVHLRPNVERIDPSRRQAGKVD